MNCKFNVSSCSPTCDKYNLCTYMETQKQLANLSEQINSIFGILNTMGDILTKKSEYHNRDNGDIL